MGDLYDMKKALICGISGQDGAYLSKLLLEKGYEVYGTSRDAQLTSFINLKSLGIRDQIKVESMALNDFRSIIQTLTKIQPDEIYNLAGQSSVGLSFQQPVETLESIIFGTLNLLEAIRFTGQSIKFYNACSSECFGENALDPADETTLFCPKSPYAVAKASAFWQVANYREAYGLFASSGILFNHESPLRHERFVTQKIVAAACRIAKGSKEKLHLGNIDIQRDWGWASEYVNAMWLMLQQEQPDDFVIATGTTEKLEFFLETVFSSAGIDWQDHVLIDRDIYRPSDLSVSRANPSKAREKLGWYANYKCDDVARMMLDAQFQLIGK